MSKITYPASSAYAATPQTSWHIGRYVHRGIPPHEDDTPYVIEPKYALRPDLLAYDLYGRESLAWIFVSRNIGVMRDMIWDFTVGTEIMVPSAAHLKETLGL